MYQKLLKRFFRTLHLQKVIYKMSLEHKKLVLDFLKKPTYNLGRKIRWSRIISEIENELDKNSDPRSYKKKSLLLNGFYLVNLVALWQVFIEDLIEYGCDLIERNIDSNAEKLLHKISLDRSEAALKKFNTPDRGRIDQIFLDCFGVKNITECWKNEDGNFIAEYAVLLSVLKTRHHFVHTGCLDRELSFNDNYKFAEDVFNLAKLLQDKLIFELGNYNIK